MGKYHIKHWDNYKMPPIDEDSFYIDGGYKTLEAAIDRAKSCVASQVDIKKNSKLASIIDLFNTMGQDPVIYEDATGKHVNAFSSIDYITELFENRKK